MSLQDSFIYLPLSMKDLTKTRLELLLLFILMIVIMPLRHSEIDFEFWTNWALKIHRDGLVNVYNDSSVNYHPVYLYILYLYDLVQGSEYLIKGNINHLKMFGLVFDFLPIVVLCAFRQNIIKEKIPYLFLLLNIAYLFNSMIWGQVDSVHTNLSFLALLFAFTNPLLSGFLFAVAIGTKLQAIIFLPILVIIWLYSIRNVKTLIGLLLIISGTLFIICLPFILAGTFGQLWQVVTGAVGKYPVVSIGAFNIWYLIAEGDLGSTLDSSIYFILTYKQLGLLLFLIASTIVLLPMLFRMARLRLSNVSITTDTQKLLMLTGGLIALCFFYFNTQMHERYATGIVIYFFFYGIFSKNYTLYILASISYFLTLDKCFPDYLPIVHYKIIFASKVIAIWYTITLAYAFYEFFRQYKVMDEWKLLRESGNTKSK